MAQRMDVVELKPGDLIEIFRRTYQHWAIYVGDGYVIHLTTASGAGFSRAVSVSNEKGIVKMEKLLHVAGGDEYRINNLLDNEYVPKSVSDILKDAWSLAGWKLPYSITQFNCEHFATAMRYGKPESRQDVVELKPGDLIEIFRRAYQHWAIYFGDGYVIHLTTASGASFSRAVSVSNEKGNVKMEKLLHVAGGDEYHINNLLDDKYEPRRVDDILEHAWSLVGQKLQYNVTQFNCEHFATAMRYGKPESQQVRDAKLAVEKEGFPVIIGRLVSATAVAISGSRRKERRNNQ